MRIQLSALVCAALLVLAGCGEADLTASAAATVNGQEITVDEVDAALEDYEDTAQFEQLTTQESPDKVRRQFQQGYLSQIVRRFVLNKEAEEHDIEVTKSEVDEALEQAKAGFPGEEEFETAVDEQGLSTDQLPDLIRDQLLETKLREEIGSDVAPADDEVRSHYDENIDQYRETKASHILVGQQRKAARIAEQLQEAPRGQLDRLFARLANQSSEDPGSAQRGGDLGYYSPGDFVPEFEQAASELEVGAVSDPVQSQFGFHIIRVTDRRLAPFEEVRDQIAQELGGSEQEEAFQEFIVEAYEDADVRINSRFGELDLETQRIRDATAEDVPGAEVPEETPAEGGGEQPDAPPSEE